jgi:hypothetical protein
LCFTQNQQEQRPGLKDRASSFAKRYENNSLKQQKIPNSLISQKAAMVRRTKQCTPKIANNYLYIQ